MKLATPGLGRVAVYKLLPEGNCPIILNLRTFIPNLSTGVFHLFKANQHNIKILDENKIIAKIKSVNVEISILEKRQTEINK